MTFPFVIPAMGHGATASGRSFSITPPVGGKSFWNLDVDGPLNLTAAGTWTIVPALTFTCGAKIWGGAAGGAYVASQGAGAAVGNVTLNVGVSYTLTVGGQGFAYNSATTPGQGGTPGGGGSNTFLSGGASGGGGFSGITQAANDILIAGGSGGVAFGTTGGVGGGTVGGDGDNSYGHGTNGKGGTQNAGGAAGAGGGTAGTARQGGIGNTSGAAGGGPGGGGRFGGGGGGLNAGDPGGEGGGGGSGYFDPATVALAALMQGGPTNPGNAGDPNWNGTAGKGVAANTNGNPGQLRLGPPAPSLTVVGAVNLANATTSNVAAWPSGTQAGDLGVLIVTYGTTTALTGWTLVVADPWPSYSYYNTVYCKVLTAADISAPPTVPTSGGGTLTCLALRGPTGLVFKSGNDSTSATVTTWTPLANYTPAGEMGALVVVADRDPTSTGIVPPSGWLNAAPNFAGQYFVVRTDYLLGSNGAMTGFTWTNFVSTSFQHGTILEMV